MSDTIPMGQGAGPGLSDSSRPPDDKTVKHDTTPGATDSAALSGSRDCIHCGERFSGLLHTPCPADDKTIKVADGPKRGPGDLPAEAVEAAADPARSLNQYVLVRQIGKGGMGVVWKAWDRTLTRWVAIKFLLAEEADAVARFRREAQISARLRHPNIAAIYEVGTASSKQLGQELSHYLAMEFVDGQTLAGVALPLTELLEIFLRIAKAVESAHQSGVVHRDLKPANIMITKDKWPYVMDFGLAKALEGDTSMSISGAALGTPAYMPPEQAEGRLDEIDARSDVYALGATLYTVLLGRPPFGGSSAMQIIRKVCSDPPPPPRSLKPDFPVRLEAVLLKAMAKERKDRQPGAAAFGDDLALCLAEACSTAGTATTVQNAAPVPAPRGGSRVLTVAVILLALAAGAVAVVQLRRTPPPVRETPKREEQAAPAPGPAPEQRTFALRIAVHPYARVVRVVREGKPVELAERDTPVLYPGLEIGDYDVVLSHPASGEKSIRLPGGSLRSGKTYVLWGRMADPTLQVAESP